MKNPNEKSAAKVPPQLAAYVERSLARHGGDATASVMEMGASIARVGAAMTGAAASMSTMTAKGMLESMERVKRELVQGRPARRGMTDGPLLTQAAVGSWMGDDVDTLIARTFGCDALRVSRFAVRQRTIEERVPGGYLGRWLVRRVREVEEPCCYTIAAGVDPFMGREMGSVLVMHPDIRERYLAQMRRGLQRVRENVLGKGLDVQADPAGRRFVTSIPAL